MAREYYDRKILESNYSKYEEKLRQIGELVKESERKEGNKKKEYRKGKDREKQREKMGKRRNGIFLRHLVCEFINFGNYIGLIN